MLSDSASDGAVTNLAASFQRISGKMVGWFRQAAPALLDSTAGLGDRLDSEWLSEHCFGDGAFRRLPRTTKDTVTPNKVLLDRSGSPTFTSSSVQKHMSWPFVDLSRDAGNASRPSSAPINKNQPNTRQTFNSVRPPTADSWQHSR